MSLIVKTTLDNIKKYTCSKSFVAKIFDISKTDINIINTESIIFNKIYNYNDLNKYDITLPTSISSVIMNNVSSLNIKMETTHKIIKNTDTSFIIKYSTVMNEPELLKNIVGDTRIVLYVQFNINKNNSDYTNVSFINKRFVSNDDTDCDNLIIDYNNNDVVNNIYDEKELVFNENIVTLSETFLGKDFVNKIAKPIIIGLFNEIFNYLQETYTKKFIKFFSKKEIEVLKKK